MKKNFLMALILFILMFGLKSSAMASNVIDSGTCGSGVIYTITDDHFLTISGSGYIDDDSWRSYSDYIQHIKVNEGVMNASCFQYLQNLESVTLPNSVISIGFQAFKGCTNLKSVNISTGVTTIGEKAFMRCSQLQNVTLPSTLTSIGDYAFESCVSLSGELVIPRGVTTIGQFAYFGCTNISDIRFPDTLETIGSQAFTSCRMLTRISIPDTVTTVGRAAFTDCNQLISVTMPDRFNIGIDDIFSGTPWKVKYHHGVSGAMGSLLWKIDENCVMTISGVGELKEHAVSGLEYSNAITEVIISEGVTSIGDSAFASCIGLKKVSIAESVTSIARDAFSGCFELADINLPKGLAQIDERTFFGCWKLVGIEIPDGVTSIKNRAFAFCKSLSSITIPNSVTNLGYEIFKGCESLSRVTLPCNLKNYEATFVAQGASVTVVHQLEKVAAKEATYEEKGNREYYQCSVCRRLFLDEKAETEVSSADVAIDRLPVITLASVSVSQKSLPYTGKAITQKVVVLDTNGKEVDPSIYGVKYTNNKKVGTAFVTVSAIAPHMGTVKTEFKIVPKKVTISTAKSTAAKTITVRWKKNTTGSGYEVGYTTDKKFKKSIKKIDIKKNKTTSAKLTKLKSKKTYYVAVRAYKKVSGKQYYSEWSKVKAVKVK